MTLASCLHRRELRLIELRAIDISPNQMLTRTSGNRAPLCRRTHPLLLDSEIHDGVRFGRDFARNPLNYVNACVRPRQAVCWGYFRSPSIAACAATTVAISHFRLNQINHFEKRAATAVAVFEFSITVVRAWSRKSRIASPLTPVCAGVTIHGPQRP